MTQQQRRFGERSFINDSIDKLCTLPNAKLHFDESWGTRKEKLFKKFSNFHFESFFKNPPDVDGVVHPASLPLVEERQAA